MRRSKKRETFLRLCVFSVSPCIVGKCRHGIVAALSMKFDEPATVELAEKRRHIDYTKHRQQAE